LQQIRLRALLHQTLHAKRIAADNPSGGYVLFDQSIGFNARSSDAASIVHSQLQHGIPGFMLLLEDDGEVPSSLFSVRSIDCG
jgi:hypothetical protein